MKNTPVKSKDAHADYKKLLEVLHLGRMAGALLGQQLYRLKGNNAFKDAIGEGVDTWEEFLKMPEINLETREANRAMEIYEEFVIKRGYSTEMLAEAGTKTLHYLLPMVKKDELTDKQIGGLLKAGAALPQKSFREKLHEVKHPETPLTYEFVLMRRCIETNNLQKVHEIDHEQIMQVFKLANIDLNQIFMPEVI